MPSRLCSPQVRVLQVEAQKHSQTYIAHTSEVKNTHKVELRAEARSQHTAKLLNCKMCQNIT